MSQNDKLKLAIYWAASCGGCEIATLEIAEKILEVVKIADIVFCPCLTDFKYDDVRAYDDNYIDVCFFNGAIRSSENEEIAKLLRQKSKIMVAYGSCSSDGGIPSLANLFKLDDIKNRAYITSESTDNPNKVIPQVETKVAEGEVELPELYRSVKRLADVIEVDYFMPGCPPVEEQTWAVIETIASGNLPPKGSYVGINPKSVCDECPREKNVKKIKKFYRPHEIIPDDKTCLLEQGIICLGPATRAGCDARCISANLPCRGCYGKPEHVKDQGAKMLSAIASNIDSQDPEEIDRIISEIVDPAGTFYRFSLADSIFKRRVFPS